eukprot:c19869_g2_i5.p1 GENE.c19869_g2_i5~~c19869_g2_i5.p1  ORF type:complete len:299 (+),score=64.60 c19869_g2_i5:972-1868(+)
MASDGALHAVEWILDHSSEGPNVCNTAQQTPLHLACSQGHVLVIAKLVERGADLNFQNRLGHTPVFFACNSPELHNVVLQLARSGADLCHRDNEGNTILHSVAQGNPELVRFLIDLEDALATAVNMSGQTAWHLLGVCPPSRGSDAVQLLCEGSLQLSVDVQDFAGDTVLHALCRAQRLDLAQLLVRNGGASVCILNAQGQTPLDLVSEADAITLIECIQKSPPKIKDDLVHACMICRTPFSLKLRRTSCRTCGRVVCRSCHSKCNLARIPEHISRGKGSQPIRLNLCKLCHGIFAEK